jgi:hypothetical protein
VLLVHQQPLVLVLLAAAWLQHQVPAQAVQVGLHWHAKQ